MASYLNSTSGISGCSGLSRSGCPHPGGRHIGERRLRRTGISEYVVPTLRLRSNRTRPDRSLVRRMALLPRRRRRKNRRRRTTENSYRRSTCRYFCSDHKSWHRRTRHCKRHGQRLYLREEGLPTTIIIPLNGFERYGISTRHWQVRHASRPVYGNRSTRIGYHPFRTGIGGPCSKHRLGR